MINSLLIAIGLNFDTLSVSIVEGSQYKNPTVEKSLKIGLIFGTVQALFSLIGVYLGLWLKSFLINIDHWVAFFLLVAVGLKLIKEADGSNNLLNKNKSRIKLFFLLAVATSIDALTIGITFVFINASLLFNVFTIFVITFFTAFIGFSQGKVLKKAFKGKTKIIGGLMLICIGVKILLQHLFYQ